MDIAHIIEFDVQYTDEVKNLLVTVLQSLDLLEGPPLQRPVPSVTYDDSDLDRIAEIYTKRSRFWLAVKDNQVIGMAAIKEVDAAVALLRRMFVAPAYHGTGVGKQLLYTAFKFAETQGFQIINLDTHIEMKRAHAFYEKHGFRRTAADEQQRHYTLTLSPSPGARVS